VERSRSFGQRATLAAGLSLVVLAPAGFGWSRQSVPERVRAEKVTVSLCDGGSTFTISGLIPGQALAAAEARGVAREMMAVWRETAGDERWTAWQAEEAAAVKPAPARPVQTTAQEPGQSTKFTPSDQLLWKQEEEKWIAEGHRNFHSWEALGGTIGISCDMCHPDAANTHPETYPKFQMQSKKVSLLRDMINWCIENPMKGKPLPENDPRLRSVEAYILSTRRGVPLEPGKH
jgi:hypothetical protein